VNTKVAQFGLGPIGIETLRLAAAKQWIQIVGGVDIDPAKVGKSLADITGDRAITGKVYGSFDELLKHDRPDVVLHTAGSKAAQAIEQMEPMVRAGVSVVSSCEELLFPQHRAPQESRKLDELCRQSGARVLGTGVNPGFVMDVLPICMTGVSQRVDRIYGERVVNASTRRQPLQKKIGSGMDPDEFRALFAAGKAGHAGFQESALLIAHAMGWSGELVETCEPVIAKHDIKTKFFEVPRGKTCGLHQRVELRGRDGKTPLTLDLQMYLDAENPHDAVRIEGDPDLDVVIRNGVAGDGATVAALVNAVPRILKAPAGVLLMTDLSVPSWR
jgi:2,4-diaminopentanoate dehydrogenase